MAQNQSEDPDRLSQCHCLSRPVAFRLLTSQVHELCLCPTAKPVRYALAFSMSTNIDPSYEFARAGVNVYARLEGLVTAVRLQFRRVAEEGKLLRC